jgi:hypothetical protein
MDPPLHQLCELCQKFQLKLYDRKGRWEDFWYIPIDEPGSEIKRHHKNLKALDKSAQDGCHLCSLFSVALKNNSTKLGEPEKHPLGLMVAFMPSGGCSYDTDAKTTTEDYNPFRYGRLSIIWNNRAAYFGVLRWPDFHCFIQRNVEPIFWSEPMETAFCTKYNPSSHSKHVGYSLALPNIWIC